MSVNNRVDRCVFREEAANRRVVAVREKRGRAAAIGFKTNQTSGPLIRKSNNCLITATKRLRNVNESAGTQKRLRFNSGLRWLPHQLTHRQTVTVGSQESDLLARDFNQDTREKGESLIAACC